LRQSLEGAHEHITESELVHDRLNQKLRILGLTHIAWRARNLRQAQILNTEFNIARTAWRNQRNRNQHITQELQNCRRQGRNLQNDKVLIEFWRDRLILRYEKWKNKTHIARQIILADQYNIRRLNRQMAILKIQIQWFRFRVINLQINPPLPVIQQPQVRTSWLILH
jgi:hypothetical protein